MKTLYSLLNAETKAWWYHAQLRRQGRIAEARELERKYIRSSVAELREALANDGVMQVRASHGDWMLSLRYYASHGGKDFACNTLSGYDGSLIPDACRVVGIPVLTVTRIDYELKASHIHQTA